MDAKQIDCKRNFRKQKRPKATRRMKTLTYLRVYTDFVTRVRGVNASDTGPIIFETNVHIVEGRRVVVVEGSTKRCSKRFVIHLNSTY